MPRYHLKINLSVLLLVCSLTMTAQSFDKNTFYQAIQSADSAKINQQQKILTHSSIKEKQAYQGVLLLKKAGFLVNKRNKLETFKDGKHTLEFAIAADSTNAEYRFLRLMIQENAPKILGYHHDLEKDNVYIRENLKTLSPLVQQAVMGYSKQSKILSNLKNE